MHAPCRSCCRASCVCGESEANFLADCGRQQDVYHMHHVGCGFMDENVHIMAAPRHGMSQLKNEPSALHTSSNELLCGASVWNQEVPGKLTFVVSI